MKIIIEDNEYINNRLKGLCELIKLGLEKGAVVVSLGRDSRSVQQNRLLWPLLEDMAKQIDHCGMKLSKEDWKCLITASFEGQMRMVPNLEGNGFVMLGASTRVYSKKKFSDLIEFIYSVGSERGVKWSEASNRNYGEVRG